MMFNYLSLTLRKGNQLSSENQALGVRLPLASANGKAKTSIIGL
jgi:hypothetical protein